MRTATSQEDGSEEDEESDEPEDADESPEHHLFKHLKQQKDAEHSPILFGYIPTPTHLNPFIGYCQEVYSG
jgi:hypothetical protein